VSEIGLCGAVTGLFLRSAVFAESGPENWRFVLTFACLEE
jgi:hypothetical protein